MSWRECGTVNKVDDDWFGAITQQVRVPEEVITQMTLILSGSLRDAARHEMDVRILHSVDTSGLRGASTKKRGKLIPN